MAEQLNERVERVIEITTRLLTTNLDDPTWKLDRQAFYGAIGDAVVMEALGVPDDVLDKIAPGPGRTSG